ncbi:MAG: DUF262 domain-containing protein, partial [Candidatus Zixiibacteriota bacterium]
LIVDGQQRLTSLYAVLKGVEIIRSNYKKERIYISFRPKDALFEVADATIRKDPEWIPDISQLWSGAAPRIRYVNQFLNQLKQKIELNNEESEQLFERIDRLYDLHDYPLTALELSQTVSEQDVADVFVRINSKGTLLNQADFILTLMSVFWDEGRTELEEFCKDARELNPTSASAYNYFIKPDPDQLLRTSIALGFRRARLQFVYNILRGKDLETGEFSNERRDAQFKVLKEAQSKVLNLQNWHEYFKSLIRAGYRSGDIISSQIGLLYTYGFYLIGKYDYNLDPYELRTVIARWFFMCAITGRYSSSPESTMEQDLNYLRSVRKKEEFIALLNSIVNDTLTDDFWKITLPNNLATTAARGPSLFAYYASLNLLDAKGLFSNIKISDLLEAGLHSQKTALERHHLFPKAYLKRSGVTEQRDINQIANYALVEWTDNLDISDEAPDSYLPRYLKRFSKEEIQGMYYWHALPQDWHELDYFDFLEKRRQLMAKVIRDGFDSLSTHQKQGKFKRLFQRM